MMRMLRASNPVISIFATILLALLAAGCGSSLGPLTLTAPSQTITSSSTLQFTVSGKGSNNVIWHVNGVTGGNSTVGNISATGLYTAPIAAPSPNSVTVTVQNAKKSKQTAQLPLTVINRAPSLTAVSPPAAFAGSPDQTLTLTGADFIDGVTVTADATGLATTFVSDTELSVVLPASLMTASGDISLDVSNPAPTVGTDTAVFSIFDTGIVTDTPNPQVARYTITPPVDTTVTIEFGLDTGYGFDTWTLPTPAGGGAVDILVAGMKAFSDYHMRAIVETADGSILLDQDHTYTTGGLDPATLPTLTIVPPDAGAPPPAPGVTWMRVSRGNLPNRILMLNEAAEIIWFLQEPITAGLRFLPDGTIAALERGAGGVSTFRVMNLASETLKSISAQDLNQKLIDAGMPAVADRFHHDALLLPNGHYALMTYHDKDFTELLGFEGQTISVQGDGIVVVDENLDPVWTWLSFDHLDINRHPFNFPDPRGVYDWTHSNGLFYSPADGSLIESVRHQHWVIKIDFQDGFGSGNVLWKLGNEGTLGDLSGNIESFQYAQHYPIVLDDTIGVFRVGVYDNGSQRPVLASGSDCLVDLAVACFSRAVVFEVNEGTDNATLVWEDVLPFFSPFQGSIQLTAPGQILHSSALSTLAVGDNFSGTVREVTMDNNPPLIIWQLDVGGQNAIRAVRFPSPYPGVQW